MKQIILAVIYLFGKIRDGAQLSPLRKTMRFD